MVILQGVSLNENWRHDRVGAGFGALVFGGSMFESIEACLEEHRGLTAQFGGWFRRTNDAYSGARPPSRWLAHSYEWYRREMAAQEGRERCLGLTREEADRIREAYGLPLERLAVAI